MSARSFFAGEGADAAFRSARAFAGTSGRVADMRDVVEARIAAAGDGPSWTRYFTTSSSEFVGRSPGGVTVLVVLHGSGPLSDADGIERAYAFHSREDPGARVPESVFRDVLSGRHGEPFVVDLDAWVSTRRHPFSWMRSEEAAADPLVVARLGGERLAADYVACHARLDASRAGGGAILELGEPGRAPYAVPGPDASALTYLAASPPDGFAFAHLLSIGQAFRSSSPDHAPSIQCDLGVHDRYDGVRFLALPPGYRPTDGIEEEGSAAA